MIKGTGVSKGVGMGKAFILKKAEVIFPKASSLSFEEEIKRFTEAKDVFIKNTNAIKDEVSKNLSEEQAAILEAHIMILEDPQIKDGVLEIMKNEGATTEHAVAQVFNSFSEIFASLEDELLRQRAQDLLDIKQRLLEILTDKGDNAIEAINEACVLVTRELPPSYAGKISKVLGSVKGIIVEEGGYTSHFAILARAMEIPTVIISPLGFIKEDDFVIVDGHEGEVIHMPSAEQVNIYKAKAEADRQEKLSLEVYKNRETVTKDGKKTALFANISGLEDMEAVLENFAEGIGLFRTEFLFMEKAAEEEEQFEIYKKAAQAMNGKPVIIRTMDIGGDKDIPWLKAPKEENPFLGLRGIRQTLKDKEVFKTQIRAILRASAFGNVKILLPMISCIEEIYQSKEIIEAAKMGLDATVYNKDIEVGIMVETPAAVVMADVFAKACDFISIGTNDLTQYTLAVDRGNASVAYLYDYLNPGVLRLIANVIIEGKKAGVPVGMCGEAAGDESLVCFLAALGLDEFSVTPSRILSIRKQISQVDTKGAGCVLVEKVLGCSSAREVRAVLKQG